MSNDTLLRISTILSDRVANCGDFDAKTPLLSSGLNLDSTAVLELILEVEREFSIEFDDEDLSIELFRTVGSLADAVTRKRELGPTSEVFPH